jgi:hypothetical protein
MEEDWFVREGRFFILIKDYYLCDQFCLVRMHVQICKHITPAVCFNCLFFIYRDLKLPSPLNLLSFVSDFL